MAEQIIIDATDAVLGRLASYAAKQALLGKNIVIVNCDKVIITGKPSSIITEWHTTARRGGHSLKGPFVPRKNTERMVKRAIRGMLSYKQVRGLEAFQRIMCHPNVPTEFQESKKITIIRPLKTGAIKLADLSKHL